MIFVVLCVLHKKIGLWKELHIVSSFSEVSSQKQTIQPCYVHLFSFSNYIESLPLVFIFGIATSVSSIHRLLPNEVSSLLCMEKFQAPPSTEYLTLVINQVNHNTDKVNAVLRDKNSKYLLINLMFYCILIN